MLSISKPMHGSARADYYFSPQSAYESVLSGGLEPTQWMGGLAQYVGIVGAVDKQELKNLFDGYDTGREVEMVRNAGEPSRQSAWDLTFSAPKSVSVLLAFSDPERQKLIVKAHDHAVRATLDQIESAAGLTRRGHGGKTLEPTLLMFATFRHSLSRENEPNLHTHALLINAGINSIGEPCSIYTKEVFRLKRAAGLEYQLQFAAGLLREFHLRTDFHGSGFRLIDVPQSACREFSTRRKQLEDLLRKEGWEGAVAAKVAALRTRKEKEPICPRCLLANWEERANKHGFGKEKALELYEQGLVRKAAYEATLKEGKGSGSAEPSANPPKLDYLTSSTPQRETKNSEREPRQAQGDSKPTPTPEPVLPRSIRRIPEEVDKYARFKPPEKTPSDFSSPYTFSHDGGAHALSRVERLLQKIPLPQLVVEKRPLFKKAPDWSPFSKITVSHLAFKFPRRPRRTRPEALFSKNLPFVSLKIEKKPLFPSAPEWSPAKNIALPYVALKKKRNEPVLKQRIRPMM